MLPASKKCSKLTARFIGKPAAVKKILILTTIVVISLISLTLLSIFALMQTRYAPATVSFLFDHFTPYRITAQQAHYSPPLQLSLTDVEINHLQQNIQVPKLTLWLSHTPWQQNKIVLDSLLIEGATLDLSDSSLKILQGVKLNQLALKHVDISHKNWSAREVNLQVGQPIWTSSKQSLPFGDIQLAVKQLYVQGEALNELLIDAKYQAQDSTVFGASFKWQGAEISGQAEQFGQSWSLINATIDGLDLSAPSPKPPLINTFNTLGIHVHHINSLDILRSNINIAGWQFEHLDASLENIELSASIWQQTQGYLSFDAERLSVNELSFINPSAEIAFKQDGMNIEWFNAELNQGWLQLNGLISPSHIALRELQISGVKWLEGLHQFGADLSLAGQSITSLSIDDLSVKNSQFIQVDRLPYWQVSGLTVDGSQLKWQGDHHLSWQNGQIELSANNASFDKLLTTHMVVQAAAHEGKLTLDRAFLPLKAGYIEANGQWDRTTASQPWTLSVHADGVPSDINSLQAALPFSTQGQIEISGEFSGLAGDYAMLAHSVTGQAQVQLHNGKLSAKSVDGEQSFDQPWPLEIISVYADRGRVAVHSKSPIAELTGNIDLTKTEFATLLLSSGQACQRLWSDVFSRTNVIEHTCDKQDFAPPAITGGAKGQETLSNSSPSTAL